ncbi:C-type lectin 2 [Plakobranchus ocellatus]|uniref:C-type lectin 2 n=1 Tax=Plakobranchus ocellatus TaxID=259542 RepID=A0AAV4BC79_9GAST|nr:C-type lectin 2 [Plakobranchus ocellatus]
MALQSILLLLVVLVIGTVQGNLSPLQEDMQILSGVGWDGYVVYNVSPEYKGSMYYISRDPEPFNLAKMNMRCKGYGGYLVQIDNYREYRYLRFQAVRRRSRTLVYTGITDLGSEGRFYNFNDKKPAGYLRWRRRQPDNWKGNEHCVHITIWGLNDIGCDGIGRYICEIPV